MMKSKEQKLLESAHELSASTKSWADLSNALFNQKDGLVAKSLPS